MSETVAHVQYNLPKLCCMCLYARALSYKNKQSVHQVRLGWANGEIAVFAEYLNGRRIQ